MFTKFSKVLCLVAVALMLVPVDLAQAQEQKGQVVVISPKVGETIDREERDRYGLFPASRNFHSAVIIERPDGSYAAEITEDHQGRMEARLLPIDRKALELLRQRIEGILPRGESFRAQENPTIVITDSYLHQWEGRLMGMEADSVIIEPPQSLAGLEPKRISILNVQSILLRKPTKIHQGIAGGCLFGAIFGAIGGLVAAESEPGDYWTRVKIHSIAGAAVYGAIGAVIGGVAGGFLGRDQLIDLSEKLREERIKILRQIARLQVEQEKVQ